MGLEAATKALLDAGTEACLIPGIYRRVDCLQVSRTTPLMQPMSDTVTETPRVARYSFFLT
jgi:hypothetical protein